MNRKRIRELRKELEAERISLDEIHEIECAAELAGFDLGAEDGTMCSDLLNRLEELIPAQKRKR